MDQSDRLDRIVAQANAFAASRHASDHVNVFDWAEAARLLRAGNVTEASTGLLEDWFWTGDYILVDGRPLAKTDAFLRSHWAPPALQIGDQYFLCYLRQPTNAAYAKQWPDEALAILRGEQ